MTSVVQPVKEKEHFKMVIMINGFPRLGQMSNCSNKKTLRPQIVSFITFRYLISFQLLILFAVTGNYMELFFICTIGTKIKLLGIKVCITKTHSTCKAKISFITPCYTELRVPASQLCLQHPSITCKILISKEDVSEEETINKTKLLEN